MPRSLIALALAVFALAAPAAAETVGDVATVKRAIEGVEVEVSIPLSITVTKPDEPDEPDPDPDPGEDVTAAEVNATLGPGVNFGNWLEAPWEGAWRVVMQPDDFLQAKAVGFTHIRLPVRFHNRTGPGPAYTVDPAFFDRVDWALDQALAAGLMVIIDQHHYDPLYSNVGAQRARFLAIWDQIARRYASKPVDKLLFEIVNEPRNSASGPALNSLIADALGVIRQSNPHRIVLVGPTWNSPDELGSLSLPADDRLILSVHQYEPIQFTHQWQEWTDPPWMPRRDWNGTAAEKGAIAGRLDKARSWAEARGIPVNLGEFGVAAAAPLESRMRWLNFNCSEAERRGWSWTVWQWRDLFGVNEPAVLSALCW